ncbi:isocitrate dehydrogenase [Endozoicomonas montiporae]|uniref:Isocitrate dehydrogenase kinase/phosphatase n=2 Tax=Endozoicomonas montiporae TaxID=1027273 RepID=A0A081N5H1_9GAMM|nr:bifunctional isocitrate dehydrogenase kinase/phosphatase [Endozoicomonas montiporae]AMO57418.1 bifunctional isocitrate dehydrogenase kinase/phosphatase [Endozoicomonas montiporae CL-33]KEQ13694.1 isocitrate dehydrogenase [Endozoicomonas montiporae]
MLPSITEQQLSHKLARAILAGFESMFAEFLNITLGAQSRFERAAWQEVQDAMRQRLQIYENKVELVCDAVKVIAYQELDHSDVWQRAKNDYAQLVADHENALIAQTFFNSIYGTLLVQQKIRDVHRFILQEKFRPAPKSTDNILYRFTESEGVIDGIRQVLNVFPLRIPFENLERDLKAAHSVLEKINPVLLTKQSYVVEFGRSLFFRNKAAYIVGQLMDSMSGERLPFAIALLNRKNSQGNICLYLDAFIIGEEQLSKLFGFARSYFMVDTDQPVRYVDYLCSLLPNKERFELFNAIGFIKHAKTEFYRFKVDYTKRMPRTTQYVSAPGVKGMVMLVFTTPDSDYVYKVIRDRFRPPKTSNRQEVMDKYDFVKQADRVGRLVDTHEFNYLAFDRQRFSDELLEEMTSEVADSITLSGNALILKHVYVERKVQPLNLYIKDASESALKAVIDDYGRTIKQLAAANIFPGDMLIKNFGVTRWGRVVFYDYDEICPLTDCHFRALPKPENEIDALAEQPWFDIGEDDVFPEQFPIFFAGHSQAKQHFDRLHHDLYGVDFWEQTQKAIKSGILIDVYSYKEEWQLSNFYN